MTFFEPPVPEPEPTPPAQYGPPIWTGPSELILGTWVPAQELLTKTDDAAVVLRGLCAWPNGFELYVSFLGRPPHTPQMHQAFFGRYMAGRGPRFGFEFSDGRRAVHSVTRGGFNVAKDENGIPTEPVLMPRGGAGGGGEWRQDFWVWPLPPEGRLVLHFDWPDRAIPDMAVELDGTEVRHAGRKRHRIVALRTSASTRRGRGAILRRDPAGHDRNRPRCGARNSRPRDRRRAASTRGPELTSRNIRAPHLGGSRARSMAPQVRASRVGSRHVGCTRYRADWPRALLGRWRVRVDPGGPD